MRGVAAGIAVLLVFGLVMAPSASACSVHVHDPKNPNFSEDCKDPDNWIDTNGVDFPTSIVLPLSLGT